MTAKGQDRIIRSPKPPKPGGRHRREPPTPAVNLRHEINQAKRRLIWEFASDEVAKEEKLHEKSLAEVVNYVIKDHVGHGRDASELKKDLATILGEAVMRLGGTALTREPMPSDNLKRLAGVT